MVDRLTDVAGSSGVTDLVLRARTVPIDLDGAPLLNERTGGVCGVLRLTRDETKDLGGYAVPIEILSARSPVLMRQNRAYHDAHPREWFDLLPPDQKRALIDARAGAQGGGRF